MHNKNLHCLNNATSHARRPKLRSSAVPLSSHKTAPVTMTRTPHQRREPHPGTSLGKQATTVAAFMCNGQHDAHGKRLRPGLHTAERRTCEHARMIHLTVPTQKNAQFPSSCAARRLGRTRAEARAQRHIGLRVLAGAPACGPLHACCHAKRVYAWCVLLKTAHSTG